MLCSAPSYFSILTLADRVVCVRILSQALQTFLAQERVVEAHMLLHLLQQMGLPVDVVMYNLVMTGYKKKRLWQPVFQVRRFIRGALT